VTRIFISIIPSSKIQKIRFLSSQLIRLRKIRFRLIRFRLIRFRQIRFRKSWQIPIWKSILLFRIFRSRALTGLLFSEKRVKMARERNRFPASEAEALEALAREPEALEAEALEAPRREPEV